MQLLSQPGAQMFLQKSVVYGMTSRPIFCSLGRGRSGPPTLYQLYGCCLEQYQGRQDRGGSWTKFALLAQSVMWGMWTRPILVKKQSYWIGSFRIGPLTYWSTNLSGRLYKTIKSVDTEADLDAICWFRGWYGASVSWGFTVFSVLIVTVIFWLQMTCYGSFLIHVVCFL